MENESNFKMIASAAAFETLTTKLYKDPYLAIVRELSTNANDAHIEAGNEDPFELHIPTDNEPFFRIRDYGEGMSEEIINNVYTTFFLSTKSEDETQTGAFGLGSKSPFSLVDEYTVISYYDGKKLEFLMSKKNGLPSVRKVSEENTNEHSGLEIKFDVSRGFYNFDKAATDLFKTTSFLPLINITFDEDFYKQRALYQDNILTRTSYSRYNHCCDMNLNVAGVGFPIDTSKFESIYSLLSTCNFNFANIVCNKNDVTITPSREELHYDTKTVEFIENSFRQLFEKTFEDYKQKEFFTFEEADFILGLDNVDFIDLAPLKAKAHESYNKIQALTIEGVSHYNKFSFHRGTRGSNNYGGYRRFKETRCDAIYILDTSKVVDTKRKGTIKTFLGGGLISDTGNITSNVLRDTLKNIIKNNPPSSDRGYYSYYSFIFPADDISAKDLEKYFEYKIKPLSVKVVDYNANVTTSAKKAVTHRGFLTAKSTYTWNKYYNGALLYSNSGKEPGENDICLITKNSMTLENVGSKIKAISQPENLYIRLCTDNNYPTMKKAGYEDAEEYLEKLLVAKKDALQNELEALEKWEAINAFEVYSYGDDIRQLIDEPCYRPLERVPVFNWFKKHYTKQNYENVEQIPRETKNVLRGYKEYKDLMELKNDEKQRLPELFPMLKFSGNNIFCKTILDYMLLVIPSIDADETFLPKEKEQLEETA